MSSNPREPARSSVGERQSVAHVEFVEAALEPLLRRRQRSLPPGIDIEDIHQETWLRVLHASRRGLLPPTPPRIRGWLRTLVRSAVSTKLHEARTYEEHVSHLCECGQPQSAPSCLHDVLCSEFLDRVGSAIGKLSDLERNVVGGRAAGQTFARLSDRVHMPPSTVRYVFKRCLERKLRPELAGLVEG